MLSWTLGFFILAIVAAALGFSGLAADFQMFAWILFVLFLALFAIRLVRGSNTRPWR
jgi:uncharacterized membrane protein YtjA (UPF0391 family)